jgi:ubiquinone/menaquinone biosynthesis C-methylase UbiE
MKDSPTRPTLPAWAETIAPCLVASPYSAEARQVVAAALSGPEVSAFALGKVLAVYNLCFAYRRIERTPETDPLPAFVKALADNAAYLTALRRALPAETHPVLAATQSGVLDVTADHYGELFKAFDDPSYFDEPKELLRQRLERNGFDLTWLQGKTGLDSGCGNGRYTVALKRLGLAEVHGLDLSETNIADAKRRSDSKALTGIHYLQGDVLDLPFENERFDFVFSNGVLHHTTDCVKGVQELLRVLKPGGRGFFMVMPNPGGMHWDLIEMCRVILHGVPHEFAHGVFDQLGMPKNLRFLYLDHILVPINNRYTNAQCRDMLTQAGAINIRRFTRGADVDGNEALQRGKSYAELLFGAGIHRYVFDKPAA